MRLLATICLAAAASSCIVPAPSEKTAEKQQVKSNNSPPLEVRLGANLEDKVEIVGASVTPGRATPGESVKVTTFFKVLDTIPSDYMIFVHVEDVDGRMERLNADHAPIGGSYPTSQWKKGETLRDEFSVYLPPGVPSRGINILLGLWDQKTDQRMKLKNTDAVKNDGNNRILLVSVPVLQQQ